MIELLIICNVLVNIVYTIQILLLNEENKTFRGGINGGFHCYS